MWLLGINSIVFIILPIVAAQYALAIFSLTRLAYLKFSVKSYVLWNIFILVGLFVGSITFLIYYYTHKDNREKLDDKITASDAIVDDENILSQPENKITASDAIVDDSMEVDEMIQSDTITAKTDEVEKI